MNTKTPFDADFIRACGLPTDADLYQRFGLPAPVSALCGAKCRTGQPCKRRKVPGKNRCPNHGGLSTGAKTEAGRAAIAESNRRRAEAKREQKKDTKAAETFAQDVLKNNQNSVDKTSEQLTPLPGFVASVGRRCGKPNCHCAQGQKHGLYYVRYWYERGKKRVAHIPAADVEKVRAACALHQQEQQEFRRTLKRGQVNYRAGRDNVADLIQQLKALGF